MPGYKIVNKNGNFSAMLSYKISWYKLCLDIIVPYKTHMKGKSKVIVLKYVTIIDPITGWFKMT